MIVFRTLERLGKLIKILQVVDIVNMYTDKIDHTKNIAIVLATGLNGLGAIRSLNLAGFKPIVITDSDKDLSTLSSLPHKIFIVKKDSDWHENVSYILDNLSFDYLPPIVACSDRAAGFLADNVEKLSLKYNCLIPSQDVTQTLNDKKLEIDKMNSANVPMPKSLSNISKGLTSDKLTALSFPIIVKPRIFEYCQLINAKNLIITNEKEWHEFYVEYQADLDKLIAQEVIPGGDENLWVCNVTFNKDSKLIAAFSFQRLGTMPSHYGVTSMAISKLNQRVIELSEQIGVALGYVGPAMFEFKYDENLDEYLYIETNPRLGMCNWFDTCCGVNNVEAACLAAININTMDRPTQKTDVLFVNVMGDLISRLEDRESIISILKLYFKLSFTKKVWAVFVISDPYPFFVTLRRRLFQLISRVFNKVIKKIL